MNRAGRHSPSAAQGVVYGIAIAEALGAELERRGTRRALLVTNTSLAGAGGLAEEVSAALGECCVAQLTGIRAHSPRADVLRIAAALAGHEADLVVGFGGGSVCDATKAATLALANEMTASADLDRLREPDGLRPATLPFVAIPTTLSAGEFTSFAGVTDERVPRKEVFFHPSMAPDVVVLDPALTVATPPRLFFGTGIRAVDHCVETFCSINVTPPTEATALHAARLLPGALRRVLADPDDLDARLDCLVGAWLSVQGVSCGVDLGASHGIGHILGGTAGMPHGETSCVMLPHVLRYNAAFNGVRQAELAAAMGDSTTPLADQVQALVAALGLPGRLRDAEVPRDLLPTIAEEAMLDLWIPTNPRPLTRAEVLALLEAAW
ncbi:MAG: iron-containing alcohol dehydrogenase [Gammaproteobacteria bacterium]|nr:iron-containing alcohol dehydrogenase [Gammaproteobacteria bacterium]MCP5199911.1 iron-containing alcohol dehydrogenase [Gammaproteobacteria bacterium]